jgi:acid stress chaperone HdeB
VNLKVTGWRRLAPRRLQEVRWHTSITYDTVAKIQPFGSTPMKSIYVLLAAAGFTLATAPAQAVVLDLSTVTCKQFIEGDKDQIAMVLTWLDGWYKGDEDEAIIDTDVFVANAKKFGSYCAANPTISVVNAAEKILGN